MKDQKLFDSNFTFYRGVSRSQNGFATTNAIENITDFKILEKCIFSDHLALK